MDVDTPTPSLDTLSTTSSLNELASSSPASSACSSPTPAPTWWFDDGNVVLIAEDTLFRVHRGVLAHHSVVFRDMFMLPQPEEYEKIEGCPVVHLSDGKRELGVLLGALYEGHKFYRSGNMLTMPEVSALLRLGTKYQVDHARDEAISRLQHCFPSTLVDFPARNVYLQDPGWALTSCIHLRKKDAIGVVNLARAFDLDFLLPPAFYLCAQLDYDELVDGVSDDCGGTMRLSPHDLKICLKGRSLLTKADLRSLQPLFFPQSGAKCQTQEACVDIKREIVQELWYENLANPNALVTQWLRSYVEGPGRDRPLCAVCVEELMEAYERQTQNTWDALGKYFQVPLWPIPPS